MDKLRKGVWWSFALFYDDLYSYPHINTNCSPNFLMLGREISCSQDTMVGIPLENLWKLCLSKYVKWLEIAMINAFAFAHDNPCIAAHIQKQC